MSQVHQPIKNCTNRSRIAPTDQELYQSRGRTICSVGAAETAAPHGCAPTEFRCLGLSIFSVSESVVKKHVIFYVFLLFYLFIPLLLLANIIQENFREKTHSIETERGTKKLRAHPQRGCTCLKCTACCVGLWLAVLVYGLLCWFTVCCVGALETSAPPEEYRISFAFVSFNIVIDRCVQNTKKRTKRTLLLNQ